MMSDYSRLSANELDDRIAVLRDNLRQLVEQAAGTQGANDEERTSTRLEQYNGDLEELLAERATRPDGQAS